MKKVKIIPKVEIPGAKTLTPAEMNAIHFSTGRHSERPAEKRNN